MLLQNRTSLRKQPQWIQQGIKLGNTFHYRQKNAFVHNSFNLGLLLLILVATGGLLYLGTVFPTLLFIPLGAFGFGLLYFMLFILVVHEASHNMFLIFKNAKRSLHWNRVFGWMVCIPFGIEYIKHWEIGHQIHHFYPVESHDPQNCPETIYTGTSLLNYLAKVLCIPGYAVLRIDSACPAVRDYGRNDWLTLGMVVAWIISLSLETRYLGWPVALSAFLGIQVLVALNTLKITIEHGGEVGQRENVWLRSCSSFFPLRWLFMPFNISLHFEHHLNYCVPWYDLMAYHRQLETMINADLYPDVFKLNRDVWQQIKS